jgi:hypothetical protein
MNLVPMDLVLDYMISSYLRAKKLENLSIPEWTKEFLGTIVCGDKGGD